MTQKQERFVQTEINFALGKKGGYMPSSLGGRLISADRQRVNKIKLFVIQQLQFVVDTNPTRVS